MVETKGGFARTKWCGKLECELKMKELAGVSSRCMPLKQSGTEGACPVCGEKWHHLISGVWLTKLTFANKRPPSFLPEGWGSLSDKTPGSFK